MKFLGAKEKMYKEMYLRLFNAITDTLTEMERQNYGTAALLLRTAQQDCEEMYLGEPEEKKGVCGNVIPIATLKNGN